MTDEELKAVELALAAPFTPTEVKWKPQTVKGNRALAVAFVDARVIQDRLDDVLGVMGWQDSYECLPEGSVVCRLKIRLGGEWIEKVDVGSQSEQPDEGDRRKAAFSDALKRAAVKFGVGRYLYRVEHQWVDFDPRTKKFTQTPRLPAWALPKGEKQTAQEPKRAVAPQAKAPAPPKETAPPAETPLGTRLLNRLRHKEDQLVAAHLAVEGELIDHIRTKGAEEKHPDKMDEWSKAQVDAAVEWVAEFEKDAGEAMARNIAAREGAGTTEPLLSAARVARLEEILERKGKKFANVARLVGAEGKKEAKELTLDQGQRLFALARTWVDATEVKI